MPSKNVEVILFPGLNLSCLLARLVFVHSLNCVLTPNGRLCSQVPTQPVWKAPLRTRLLQHMFPPVHTTLVLTSLVTLSLINSLSLSPYTYIWLCPSLNVSPQGTHASPHKCGAQHIVNICSIVSDSLNGWTDNTERPVAISPFDVSTHHKISMTNHSCLPTLGIANR